MRQVVDIDTIKAAASMEAIMDHYGIEVRKGVARCPFHNERNPSMKVYRDGYFCFGCGNGGDAITFVARMDHVSNAEAARRVAAVCGITLPEDDYRTRMRAYKAAQERRKAKAKEQARKDKYGRLCEERRSMLAVVTAAEPYSDAWCGAYRRLERLEGELDELYEQLGA